MIKVRAHTCYLGHSGYSAHSRSFFRELSKHVDLRIRNYTWDSNPDYINETDLEIIDRITLRDPDGKDSDYPISHSFPNLNWKNVNSEFTPDVDIVLMDMDHFYFYEEYNSKIKIAYTVWESTEIPNHFFKQLLKFDYLWVATEWHKEVIVNQGYPEFRVFVVNEGVSNEFFNEDGFAVPEDYNDNRFKFIFFGRWDYRKSVPEIIDSFLKAFPNNEPVDLIISADNPYAVDGMNSTEERMNHYGFNDERIKIKHFLTREQYVNYIKSGHVLITCARSEGWNIPLIEAMAAGTPVIYSDWGAQLEFAGGKGSPVKIRTELPASLGADLGFAGNTPGLYAEPDYEDLIEVLKDCFNNYQEKKESAVKQSVEIKQKYNWEKIGENGYFTLLKVLPRKIEPTPKGEAAVVLSHCETRDKLLCLTRCLINLKSQGYFAILSSHISVPDYILDMCDYFVCETDNPIVEKKEYHALSRTTPVHWFNYPGEYQLSYPFDFNHGFAALRLIQNGVNIAIQNGFNKTHFINYDYIIEDESTIPSHSEALDSFSVVSYLWNAYKSINSGFFSAISQDLYKAIESTRKKADYFRFDEVVILEDFLFRCIEESSLSINIRDPKDEKKKNIFNSFMVKTYPYIKTNKGGYAHIYLGKETATGEYFVCVSGTQEEEIKAEIIYNGESIEVKAPFHPMKFFTIPDEMMNNGFEVYVPEYDIKYEYSKDSKYADINIHNKDLIFNLYEREPKFNIHFIDGPFVEIKNTPGGVFLVQFIDSDTNTIKYETVLQNNHWARSSFKYYINWLIKLTDLKTNKVYEYRQDLTGKRILISFESSSLGDTLAWVPYADELRKKYNADVYVSTFKNSLFSGQYPEVKFIQPGTPVDNLYALYRIGWFYDGDRFNSSLNPSDFKNEPLQKTASDILGIEYSPIPAKIHLPDLPRPLENPYVCIAIHSTAQAKYWNNSTGWQEVTDWLISKGYKVVMLSIEEDGYMGNYYPKGITLVEGERSLTNAINYLQHSEMFIGIGSGLSWLSWSVGIPTVIISGFSNPITEPLDDKIIRIFNDQTCNSCFNRYRLDAGDWNWCPDHKGTERQFECTKSITGSSVIKEISKFINSKTHQKSVGTIINESYSLGMIQNLSEITQAAEFFKQMNVKNFMEIGTDQGGTFAIWSKLSEDGIRISVDMPHGTYGVSSYDVNKRDEYLRSLGSNVTMIHGDSHSDEIKNRISSMLKEGELDFLFIDGDHTYEGVKKDYEDYKKYVKEGGWIGFHDIKDTEFHRNANCRVDLLWNELRGEKIEFVDNSSQYGGIGFIKKQ